MRYFVNMRCPETSVDNYANGRVMWPGSGKTLGLPGKCAPCNYCYSTLYLGLPYKDAGNVTSLRVRAHLVSCVHR